MRINTFVILLLMGVAACGEDGPPNQVTSVTPRSVAITGGTDLMKLKATGNLGLTATLSDGTTSTVQGTWRSDNPAAATVDTTGRVTGAGSGEATIIAEYQGLQAPPLRLRVVPDYHGRWNGDYTLGRCTADGDWLRGDFCGEVPTGDLGPIMLGLTQNRADVNGTSDFGELPGPVQGTIRMSGHLPLSGTFTVTIEDFVVDVTLADWEALSIDNDRMTGRFALVFRSSRLEGSARVECDLRIVGKTSSTPLVADARTGGRMTIKNAVSRAIRRR
jgi:hypothetical protein